ncbi:hypothetical protein CLU88_2816 [Acidovorax sp. 56]|nr:hypothetical protein CLU88_2816 [Acidovorax sp. 56]
MTPLSRFAPSPQEGRPPRPGEAGSTGALALAVPVQMLCNDL